MNLTPATVFPFLWRDTCKHFGLFDPVIGNKTHYIKRFSHKIHLYQAHYDTHIRDAEFEDRILNGYID